MRSTWRSSSIATSPGAPPDRPVFVLDHNFPEPILLAAVERWVLELEPRRLREIDPRLTRGFDDWQVVLALSQLGFDGFVTNDDDMLWLPEVVSVIEQTAMSVVVCEETGDDSERLVSMNHYEDMRVDLDVPGYRALVANFRAVADKAWAAKAAADFPFAGGRRAQRAYLDAVRDLLAPVFGYRLLRIAAPEGSTAIALGRLRVLLE
jgi:hypothetical protein